MVRKGELTQFLEEELSKVTQVFGNIAQRFSAYSKSGIMHGRAFAARGMTSTQFILTRTGRKMSAMAWDDERPWPVVAKHLSRDLQCAVNTGPCGPPVSGCLTCSRRDLERRTHISKRTAGHQEQDMKRMWTIIGVAEVARSYQWYLSLLGLPWSAPAHDYFGQILDADGTVLLCLHRWGAHGHPTLTSSERAEPGNGLLLFFRVEDFDDALLRSRALVRELEEEPSLSPATGTREFALRDPDGYYVMVSALE